jgi:hypothetical protein
MRTRISENAAAVEKLESVPGILVSHRAILEGLRDKLAEVAEHVRALQMWQSDDRTERIRLLEGQLARHEEDAVRRRTTIVQALADRRSKVLAAVMSALVGGGLACALQHLHW